MRKLLASLLMGTTLSVVAGPQAIPVSRVESPPTVDGDVDEWSDAWQTIQVSPAMAGDAKNRTGRLSVELQARVADGRLYIAVRWPDDDENVEFRPWKRKGNKYRRSRNRDDMFALRFHMGGDYDRTMISEKSYEVDVWVWSAGRSNLAGLAEDVKHTISIAPLENAAEYESESGKTVYIKKVPDSGEKIYKTVKVEKGRNEQVIPSVSLTNSASGSAADVKANGKWANGYWELELSRGLDTGNRDDVVLAKGMLILGQIAIFNKGYSEHKSVSEPLLFDFSGI